MSTEWCSTGGRHDEAGGVLGVAAALLVSSAALAAPGTRSYEGQVVQGADSRLTFDVVKRESGKRR
ncbi:MAG: hypothetical protein ACRDMA_17435 [Solirubrobacterales bacterium]